MALHRNTAALLAVAGGLAALLAASQPAMGCGVSGYSVGGNLNSLETPTLNPDGSYQRYASEQVKAHFDGQPYVRFRRVVESSFSCVDARGRDQIQGTPGGDLAEVVAGVLAWFKYKGRVDMADVTTFWNLVFNRIATQRRPLYFHTDDSRLRRLFTIIQAETGGVEPSVFPERAPANGDVWLKHLVKSEVQGCGHIRLMLSNDTSPVYSVQLSGANVTNCVGVASSDCISSASVAAAVIEQFYRSWWFSAPGSAVRRRVNFVIDVGPLIGKAVTVVSMSNETGNCRGLTPQVFPNFGASSLFVYHPNAVSQWRRHVISFALASIVPEADRARFATLWDEIAGMQLGSTLTYLAPANAIGLFPVTVNTAPFRGK